LRRCGRTRPTFFMNIARSIAVAALCATPFLSAQDKQTPAPTAVDAAAKSSAVATPVVGIVDLVKAFEQYPRWIKLNGELKKKGEAAKGQLEEMTKRIDELRASMEVLGQDSEERREIAMRVEILQQQRQGTGKWLQDKLQIDEARAMILVYEDLEVAIKKVAKARGVALVLRVHEVGNSGGEVAKMSPLSVERRIRAYEARQVWHADDSIDLTADVIKLLMVPLDDAKTGDAKTGEPKTGENGAKKTPAPEAPKSGG
jgi:Skp family chaperone for outer membrane proteins